MFDEAISLLSIWSSIDNWLTPTTLFLLLNLMIGTIFITSSFTSSKSHHHHDAATAIHHHHHHHSPPSQLTRTPSVLERLKSINFYNYSYATATTTTTTTTTVERPSPSNNVPQHHQSQNPKPQKFTAPTIEEDVVDYEGPTLDEIYSKIKGTASVHYNRQNSDTKPSGGDLPVRLPAKIKKSASEMSAFNHFQPENASAGNSEVSEVDVRADDFITKFKKQLRLQRIESIAQYKEMITRGSAK